MSVTFTCKNCLFVVFLVYCSFLSETNSQISLLCTDESCKDVTCPNLPNSCKIQNSTHNGIFLPFPGICNCCEYCLENKGKNDNCTTGSPDSATPTSICGSGLACTKQESESTCQRMNTECTKAQNEYDRKEHAGTVGHLEIRPECDDDGNFMPFSCIPGQNCFCVDTDGRRIFGDRSFTPVPQISMKCECSRKYEQAKKLFGSEFTSVNFFRCLENGDYDPMQCVDEDCFCVDKVDGSTLETIVKTVKIEKISNETLKCYDSKTHLEFGKYHFTCHQEHLQHLEEIEDFKSKGYENIVGSVFPSCDLTGKYSLIQSNKTSKFCSDGEGNVLDDFMVSIDDPLATGMNCHCARAKQLSKEQPDCCQNGNYKRIQCRRNLCRCVDANGIQTEKEVDINNKSSLKCSLLSECT